MKNFNNRMEEQEERKRQKEWFRKGLALFNIFNEFLLENRLVAFAISIGILFLILILIFKMYLVIFVK